MKLQIRWKDCDKSKAVEAGVQDKLAVLSKYDFINQNVKAEIVYYAKTKLFKTRINVDVRHGKILRTEAADEKIYTSVNMALDKMEDQLRRVKTKMMNKTQAKSKKTKARRMKI